MIILPPHNTHSQNRGAQSMGRDTYMAPILYTSPYAYREAVDTYLQRHPYAFTSTDTLRQNRPKGTTCYLCVSFWCTIAVRTLEPLMQKVWILGLVVAH